MKKLVSLAIALCLTLCVLPAALAIEKGDYVWQAYTLTVTDINTKPMFSPADMKADEHALAVSVETSAELVGDEALRDAVFAQVRLTGADGAAYAPGVLLSMENKLTFVFALPKGVEADALAFQLVETPSAAAAMPEAYVGDWQGSTGNINLSFSVNPDGTGSYAFEQNGYTESYDFTMRADADTFSVTIPEDNQLGIVSCEGTYQYANEVLTLDIHTTFQSGREFSYTVPCTRAAQ